jgi:ankyrin repeat protein
MAGSNPSQKAEQEQVARSVAVQKLCGICLGFKKPQTSKTGLRYLLIWMWSLAALGLLASVPVGAKAATTSHCEARVRELSATLSAENHLRMLFVSGYRKEERPHRWIPDMRTHRIRQANIELSYQWDGAISKLEVQNVRFLREYWDTRTVITDQDTIAKFRRQGLEDGLSSLAFAKAKGSLTRQLRKAGLRQASGIYLVAVTDDECVPGYEHDVGGEDTDFTPLMAAASEGNSDAIESLIVQGVDLNHQDANGMTALMYAAISGRSAALSLLIEAGADVNLVDRFGRTALMLASQFDWPDAVRVLLDRNANVNQKTAYGQTALLVAAASGAYQSLRLLLAGHAEINVNDENGVTPLIAASKSGNKDVIEALLAAGASVNMRDRAGRTALDWAMWAVNTPPSSPTHAEIIEILKGAGAIP